MKIKDIILEAEDNPLTKLKKLEAIWKERQQDADDVNDIAFYGDLNNLAIAKQRLSSKLKKDPIEIIGNVRDDWNAKQTKDQTKSTAPTPQPKPEQTPQRDRKDIAGRSLKHDRYYRPSKPKKEIDIDTGDPGLLGKELRKVPGVKQTVKAVSAVKKEKDIAKRTVRSIRNWK